MREPAVPLRENRDFTKLWAAQTISKLGSHVGNAALEFTAILNLRATPAQLGLLSAAGSLPVLVVSLMAGVWVDRVRRRPLLIVADLGRALLLTAIAVAAWSGALRIGHLYLVAVLVGVLTVLYSVADQSALPALVPREQLVDANGRLGASTSVAEVGGQALGGTLVQWLTAPVALLLDIGSFLLSAALTGAIRTPEPPARAVSTATRITSEIRDGARVITRDPVLVALTATSAMTSFFGSFFGALYSLYLIRVHGWTPALVGLSVAAGGVGSFLGAFLAEPLARRFGVGPTLIGCAIVGGLIGLLIPFADGPRELVLLYVVGAQFFGDIPGSIQEISETSVRQARIPHEYLGRASASIDFVVRGAAPIGAAVGGALGGWIGIRETLFIACAGGIIATCLLAVSPLRSVRSL